MVMWSLPPAPDYPQHEGHVSWSPLSARGTEYKCGGVAVRARRYVGLWEMRLVVLLAAVSCLVGEGSARAFTGGWSWDKCRRQYEELRAEVLQLQKTVSYLKIAISKYSGYYVKGEDSGQNIPFVVKL